MFIILNKSEVKNMKQRKKILVLISLLIGIIFSELDETVVNTALPTIIKNFGGLSLYGWVSGIYMLTMTAFMPILGKLADLYGRKRIYIICISLFIGGSIVSGLAPSMQVLLIGRSLQGIGAGGLIPIAMVIVGDIFTVEERAKLQGIFGASMFIPQLLGPLIGGYFTQHISWHWIFLINLPIGLLAVTLFFISFDESKIQKEANIDWGGAFLLVGFIVSILLTPVLHENQGYAWNSPFILILFTVGSMLLVLFLYVEYNAKDPILPLQLFKNRTFIVLSLVVFTMMFSVMGAFSSFTFFAQNIMNMSPIKSGYITLPLMIGAVISSVVTGRLITKVPYRYMFVVLFLISALGFYLMAGIGFQTKSIVIIGYFIMIGLGFGVMLNNNLIIQESIPKEHSGIALSSINLFQSLGMTIGLSIYSSLLSSQIISSINKLKSNLFINRDDIFTQVTKGHIPDDLNTRLIEQLKSVFIHAFQHLYGVSFIASLVVIIFCLFLKNEIISTLLSKENKD